MHILLFNPAETKKVALIIHMDKKRCNLAIDKDIMSIYASDPGQILWIEKSFKNRQKICLRPM